MSDPFVALKNALQTIFDLEPKRMGRYTYPEIQQLQQSLDCLQKNSSKKDFIGFLKALRAALPYIEKWRIDFTNIKTSIDDLAKTLQVSLINWDQYLSRSNASPKFQFSALNHRQKEIDLLPWLTAKSGAPITANNPAIQVTLLLEYRDHSGFSQKLSDHLDQDPNFLFRLIMESDKNFIQIANTRISLYLTDKQLAEAIIKHAPLLVQSHPDPVEHATKLVDKLNEVLSNGRSVSTLLRNTEAKFVLDGSALFQIYQKGEDNQQLEVARAPPSLLEDGGLTPTL